MYLIRLSTLARPAVKSHFNTWPRNNVVMARFWLGWRSIAMVATRTIQYIKPKRWHTSTFSIRTHPPHRPSTKAIRWTMNKHLAATACSRTTSQSGVRNNNGIAINQLVQYLTVLWMIEEKKNKQTVTLFSSFTRSHKSIHTRRRWRRRLPMYTIRTRTHRQKASR